MTWRERMTEFPSREAWLEGRRQGIGGSDAPAILGLSKWATPLSLWSRKLGLVESEAEGEWLEWGNRLEPVISQKLADEANIAIISMPNQIIRHADYECLAYSPDGTAVQAVGNDYSLVEIKNTSAWKASEWDEGCPEPVYAQVQHGLDVMGLQTAYVAVLIGGNTFRWCKVDRDDEWIEEKRPLLLAFWDRVQSEDPPPAGSEDKDTLDALHPVADGEAVPLDSDGLDLHWTLQELKVEEKEIGRRIREANNQLKQAIGDATKGVLPGGYGEYRWANIERKGYTVEPCVYRALRYVKGAKDRD